MNDTIVIFDRIRENLKGKHAKDLEVFRNFCVAIDASFCKHFSQLLLLLRLCSSFLLVSFSLLLLSCGFVRAYCWNLFFYFVATPLLNTCINIPNYSPVPSLSLKRTQGKTSAYDAGFCEKIANLFLTIFMTIEIFSFFSSLAVPFFICNRELAG